MDLRNKNSQPPAGWRIEEFESYSGTGNGDERHALGLYRWESRANKRLFRKPVTETGWFLVHTGRHYSLMETGRSELIQYARDTERAESKGVFCA